MIMPPKTYAEWAGLIQAFKNHEYDDKDVIQAMKNGSLAWQSGVAERFIERFMDAINTRLNGAIDRFQKGILRGTSSDYALTQSIFSLRKEFEILTSVADIPAIPQEQRSQILGIIKQQADKIQESLENSAKRDRTGKMGNLIRNNRVNNF